MAIHPIGNIDLTRIARHMDDAKQAEVLQELLNRVSANKSRYDLFSLYQCELGEMRILHPLIREICTNLLMENYYAAVALTNMLFEATMKFGLIYLKADGRTLDDVESFEDIHKEEVSNYDDQDLEQNINACKRAGFITKDESKTLKDLSKLFRNNLSHASFSKMASGVKGKFYLGRLSDLSHMEEQDMEISNIPIFYMQYLNQFVQHESKWYFYTIMHFVEKFDKMITDTFGNRRVST